MSGTVNIARSIFHDAAFKDQPFTEREAFMWMVMEASWKDREKRIDNKVVSLKRGQLAASIRFMAEAWSWQKSTVDRFLKRLENRDMIGTDSGTGVNVITICKYNEYQGGETDSGTAKNEKRDSSGTAAGQTRTPEAIPEARREEEEAKASLSYFDDATAPIDDFAQAVSAYNATAQDAGWPKVQSISSARRTALKARLDECGGIEGWRLALCKARASPHLCGANDRGWRADFDFLTRQSKFAKLMEGSYDPRPASNQNPTHAAGTVRRAGSGGATVDAFAAVAARYAAGPQ